MSAITCSRTLRRAVLHCRSDPTMVEAVSLETLVWTGSGRPFSAFSSNIVSSNIIYANSNVNGG